jgi:general secretion pathway protein K
MSPPGRPKGEFRRPQAAGIPASPPGRSAGRSPAASGRSPVNALGRHPQRGAALLTAMIIVTIVATLASAMVWQQWHAIEVEAAERQRTQSHWVLSGALDWARLILREDARDNRRNGNPDHLGEPWAVPLAEARLSTFLAADRDHTDDAPDAFLSGVISDAQARYNLLNLVSDGKVVEKELEVLRRLCDIVGVVPTLADQLAEALRMASPQGSSASGGTEASVDATIDPPVMPGSADDLAWLGVDPASLEKLRPFVTLLPSPTRLNLNTAPKEVIAAVLERGDLASAERIVLTRERNPLTKVEEATALLGGGAAIDPNRVSVTSDFFEVYGALRLENRLFEERSLVQRRNDLQVVAIRRERVRDGLNRPLLQYHSNSKS